MAFKMNRPIIKGTASHKASIAKAVDAALIEKANVLGMSDVPHAIDYSLKLPDIDIKKKEKKDDKDKDKPEEQEVETLSDEENAKIEEDLARQARENALMNQKLREEEDKKLKEGQAKTFDDFLIKNETQWDRKEDKTEKDKTEKDKTEGQYITQEDIEFMNKQAKGEGILPEDNNEDSPEDNNDDSSEDNNDNSPTKKRDDRIWRNAKIGGPVRKNMLKNGYKPK